jgi:hypothetical protein
MPDSCIVIAAFQDMPEVENNGFKLAFILRIHSLWLEGENTHPGTMGVNRNEGAPLEFLRELPDGIYDQIADPFRYDILCSNLNNTGTASTRSGKQSPEVQVMGKDGIAVFFCVGHNEAVCGSVFAHIRPVDTFKALAG